MTVFSKSSQQLNNIKSLQFKKSIKKEKEKHKVIQTLSWLYSIVEESMVFYTQNSESTEEENLKEKKKTQKIQSFLWEIQELCSTEVNSKNLSRT